MDPKTGTYPGPHLGLLVRQVGTWEVDTSEWKETSFICSSLHNEPSLLWFLFPEVNYDLKMLRGVFQS